MTLEFFLTEGEFEKFREEIENRLNDTLPVQISLSSNDHSISI